MTGLGVETTAALSCGRYTLPLKRALVMGIVNVTPDSFSDGGRFVESAAAIAHGKQLVDEGADIVDIGAESTRPGAHPVAAEEELRRIAPVLEGLLDAGVPVSVDTSKPEVMRAVLALGADMINDVCGFRALGALEALAKTRAALCIMHMQGEPRTMQAAPRYEDVVREVGDFLSERAAAARAAGIAAERIVLDPGFGFGKTLEHNLTLLRRLHSIAARGYPVLVGISRKTMLGTLTGRGVAQREYAGVAAALLAVQRGARIVRVHDAGAAHDVLRVLDAVETSASG